MLSALEAFTTFAIILTAITQLIIPLWNDRKIFPIFRSNRRDLEKKLVVLNELEDETDLEIHVRELETKLNKILKETNHE